MRGDADLIAAYRAGDQRAGEAIVDRYYGRVLGFFRNKAPSASHDLTQRTFLGCFEGLSRLRDDSRFRSFLFGVAANQLRKHFDSTKREGLNVVYESVSSSDLDPSPSQIYATRSEHRLLLEALRRIPIAYQLVLELFFWESMTAAEIAELLELPVGTVKTRLRSGRQKLAEVVKGLADDPQVLEMTLSDLDGWAAGVRADVLASEPESRRE